MSARYVIIAQDCYGCGANVALWVRDELPTADEVRQVRGVLGNTDCIQTHVQLMQANGPTLVQEYDA